MSLDGMSRPSHTGRGTLIGLLCTVTFAVSAPGHAQQAAPCPDPCLTILTFGGLLGYVDGVPESFATPFEPADTSPDVARTSSTTELVNYGGLLGIQSWLRKNRPRDAVLLMAGNNHPQELHALTPAQRRSPLMPDAHWFWKRVASVEPGAIGIGAEDLQRWLAQTEPQLLVRWIEEGIEKGLPFVASNTIIVKSGSGVNVVRDPRRGIELRIPRNESVGPLRSLAFTHPCSRVIDAETVRFEERDAPDVVVPRGRSRVARRVGGDECRTTLQLSAALRPGRTYHIRAGDEDSRSFRFRVTTHDVLTPHASPGPWNGLPVVSMVRANVPLVVMSFVSPELATEIPSSFSRWTREDGCSEDRCRIEYLQPREAAGWWQSVAATPRGRVEPFLLILSDLRSDEADEFLDGLPEARFIAIPPASRRLGRTIGTERQRTGGHDVGPPNFGAVIDPQTPVQARVIVRPERLGQTITAMRGQVVPDASSKVHLRLTAATLSSERVRGARLVAHVDEERGEATYRAVLDDMDAQADPRLYDAYCRLDEKGPFDRSGEAQGSLWTSAEDFAALVLDQMRRSLGADISLVPASWINGDVLAWLQDRRSPARPVDWLSGFILQRVLYRSGPVVKVSVEDSDLPSTLLRIISTARQAGVPLCASGLGLAGDCPLSSIDPDELAVNLRPIYFGHSYSVALPESLARVSRLRLQGAHTLREILRPIDRRLAHACHPCAPAVRTPADARPLAIRLEEQLAERPQRFLILDPVSFEYNVTGVSEPEGAAGVFGNLATDSSNARDNRELVVDAIADFAPFDFRRWMIHVPAEIRLDRRDLDASTSFDANYFLVGLRGDYKQMPFGGRRAIAFAGLNIEGELADIRRRIRATRRLPPFPDPTNPDVTLRNVTVPGPTLTFVTRRPLFWFASVGVELPTIEFGRGVPTRARLALSIDFGRAVNVPLRARVGNAEFGLDHFILEGPSGVLRDAYEADVEGVTSDTPFGFVYDRTNRLRLELDARTNTRFDIGRIRTSNRFRLYNQTGDDPPLSPRWSWRGRVLWEAAWWRDWVLAPYAEMTLVRAEDVDGFFSVARAGVALQVRTFWRQGSGTELR